jgi:hypothetical protein
MSAVRPRHAYRVRQVTNASSLVRWDPTAKAEVRNLQIVVDRGPVSRVPKIARIHPWTWDRRESRAASQRRGA